MSFIYLYDQKPSVTPTTRIRSNSPSRHLLTVCRFWNRQMCLYPEDTAHACLNWPTFCSSGTKTFLAFLIIGCGFSSSSENLCLRGLNSSPPGTLDRTRSVGSGWKLTSTSMASGSMGEGVRRSTGIQSTGVERQSKLGYKRPLQ